VHGERAAGTAREVSDLLFGGGDAHTLSRDALAALALEIPVLTVAFTDQLTTGDVLDALCVGPDALFKSKGDMRRMVQQGGVYMNGRRLGPEREPIGFGELLGGEYLLIRKGAKTYALVRVTRS
jgi:tyrosyl-tRNA synthetase